MKPGARTKVKNIFTTSDIAIAAFLLMRNYRLISATISSGVYNFCFEDPDNNASAACIEYINSECSTFDSNLRTLRGMLRDNRK